MKPIDLDPRATQMAHPNISYDQQQAKTKINQTDVKIFYPTNKAADPKTTSKTMTSQLSPLENPSKIVKAGPVKVNVRKGANSMSASSDKRAPKPAKTKQL